MAQDLEAWLARWQIDDKDGSDILPHGGTHERPGCPIHLHRGGRRRDGLVPGDGSLRLGSIHAGSRGVVCTECKSGWCDLEAVRKKARVMRA